MVPRRAVLLPPPPPSLNLPLVLRPLAHLQRTCTSPLSLLHNLPSLGLFFVLFFLLFLRGRRQVVRNVVFEPRLLPGGGATEMAVSQALSKKAQVRHLNMRAHGGTVARGMRSCNSQQ